MKKHPIWITIVSILAVVLVLAITGIVYAAHYASTITASEKHTATGAIHVTETPIPTSASAQLQTFTIVSAQSTASYSVYEDLIIQGKPNNDAIGRTHAVTGSFQIRTGSSPLVTGMNIKVDLRTLQSDSSMRDGHVQDALDTSTYPYATFVSVSTQGLPATYTNGQTISFKLIGNLTMHGKTNGETFAVQGKVMGNIITGTASTTIYMTDFGIQPPNLANVAIVQNKVVLTLTFTAQKA
ncbi:MAG TPA: YceI family protein [Ktedonobacteraceae bacterium]|jgi:polyisoprenoid-binding protein YceI|nr:YceI family protein [Ktedonobacteraceae bacterium]